MAPTLIKSLSRLTRDNLIDLALKWLEHDQGCCPYLASNRTLHESDEEDYLHTPAQNIEELKRKYRAFKQNAKEMSKRDIIDRIVDGDWRRGLSLEQLAMMDFAYLEQNESCLRWSALKLVPLQSDDTFQKSPGGRPSKKRKLQHENTPTLPTYPQIQPVSFVDVLKRHISPVAKAHFYLHHLSHLSNLPIVRLQITSNTAFAPNPSTTISQNDKTISDSSRVMYIALPSSCPYIYISLSGSAASDMINTSAKPSTALIDLTTTKRIILEAIPKALSKPHHRWSLESTKLTAKSLKSITELRGNQKPGTGGGAYSRFAEGDRDAEHTPVDPRLSFLPTPPSSTQTTPEPETEPSTSKHQSHPPRSSNPIPTSTSEGEPNTRTQRRKTQVQTRFGSQSGPHYAPLDRIRIKIEDLFHQPFPHLSDGWSHMKHRQITSPRRAEDSAPLEITLSGIDVFGGLKMLAGAEGSSGHGDGNGRGWVVDLDRLPGELTGEEGCSGLVL